jgi:hypothetical protein
MEGLVVRREVGGWTTSRGKLVNAAFAQAIDAHWSKGALERNVVVPSTTDRALRDAG